MSVSLIVILAIVAAIVLYIISTQRTLVSLDEFCKNALSQIGVQLTSRWDLVSALVKLIEKYSKYEHAISSAINMGLPPNEFTSDQYSLLARLAEL